MKLLPKLQVWRDIACFLAKLWSSWLRFFMWNGPELLLDSTFFRFDLRRFLAAIKSVNNETTAEVSVLSEHYWSSYDRELMEKMF